MNKIMGLNVVDNSRWPYNEFIVKKYFDGRFYNINTDMCS